MLNYTNLDTYHRHRLLRAALYYVHLFLLVPTSYMQYTCTTATQKETGSCQAHDGERHRRKDSLDFRKESLDLAQEHNMSKILLKALKSNSQISS